MLTYRLPHPAIPPFMAGGLLKENDNGTTCYPYDYCIRGIDHALEGVDGPHQRGERAVDHGETCQAQPNAALSGASSTAIRIPDCTGNYAPVDHDWPPASYRPPLPEPADTDWPAGAYVAPVKEETDVDAWIAAEEAAELARRDAANRARGLPEKWVEFDRRFDPAKVTLYYKTIWYENGHECQILKPEYRNEWIGR